MFNSIIFNSGDNIMKLLKLKKYKKDITISIADMNEKKDIEKIKDKFKDTKRVIYNMGKLLMGKSINKEAVKYGLSLGKKIKAAKVNDKEFAQKIISWGVNYITTQYLHPFLIENEKEEPMKVKCNINYLHNISECKIDDKLLLKDNEIYNIYYSTNIYNLFDDIDENPIGYFKYINTNYNEKLYYTVRYINFKKGNIKLLVSNKIRKGKFNIILKLKL